MPLDGVRILICEGLNLLLVGSELCGLFSIAVLLLIGFCCCKKMKAVVVFPVRGREACAVRGKIAWKIKYSLRRQYFQDKTWERNKNDKKKDRQSLMY